MHFLSEDDINSLKAIPGFKIHTDEDEYAMWSERGDPVLHIELRKWADALLVSPLSANTLAKIATGACDNLATLVCRCWDMTPRLPYLSVFEKT